MRDRDSTNPRSSNNVKGSDVREDKKLRIPSLLDVSQLGVSGRQEWEAFGDWVGNATFDDELGRATGPTMSEAGRQIGRRSVEAESPAWLPSEPPSGGLVPRNSPLTGGNLWAAAA